MKHITLYENFGQYDAILIGGLDYRAGDLTIDQQVEKLKKTYGTDKKVMGFRYNTPTATILDFLTKNPKVDVYMFSAGCSKAEEISKSPVIDKSRVYIIEPHGPSAKQRVENAVKNGIPAQNVFVGSGFPRGEGIVAGASSSGGGGHWDALKSYSTSKRTPVSNPAVGEKKRVVKGEFFPPRGDYDAMHSFQSRKRDGFGGKMNTIVNAALLKFYTELSLNPEITSIKINADDTNWRVTWEVTIEESKDGKAWIGLTSRGGAGRKDGPGGSIARAERQITQRISTLSAELKDPRLETKRVFDFNFQGKGAYIRQIFIAYTNPAKYPPLEKKSGPTVPPETKSFTQELLARLNQIISPNTL